MSPGAATGDLVLREVAEADLPVFFEQQRDPEANRMAAFPARDWDAFIAHWADRVLDDESVIKRTIVLDGEVAGNVVSFERSGTRLVGYWIGREYWGRGVATRALSAFLGHDRARPLRAHVATTNRGSIRVLEKCGFTVAGEERGSSAAGDDEVDEVILELDAP
ncbi:MAG: GNAT family N-acetyltransferase [Solirubrobacterales bacterium]|nr:GNAT family N-acetyltransferase [Solirubrobacterales bacterium]